MIQPTDRDGWRRRPDGTFGVGNRGGPGQPRRRSSALRRALKKTCTYGELQAVLAALVQRAKSETSSAKVLLGTLVRVVEIHELEERLNELERRLNA